MRKTLKFGLMALSILAGLDLIIMSLIFGPFFGGGSVFWLQIIIGLVLIAVAFTIRPK